MNHRNLVFNKLFLVSLSLLLLNDFYLKQLLANAFTGKLSDFTGLFVFPVVAAFLFPVSRKWISMLTGVLFILWKTPLVTPLIEAFNRLSPLTIQRVVDYSDYWALLSLPFAHLAINSKSTLRIEINQFMKAIRIGIASVAVFAICATSVPPRTEIPKGTIYIGEYYTVKRSKEATIQMIRSLGYNVDFYENKKDSAAYTSYRVLNMSYYQTDNVVIYDDNSKPIDTIMNIKYALHEQKPGKTQIEIINVTLSEDGNIQKWQTLKYLRKQYRKLMEKQLIDKIK